MVHSWHRSRAAHVSAGDHLLTLLNYVDRVEGHEAAHSQCGYRDRRLHNDRHFEHVHELPQTGGKVARAMSESNGKRQDYLEWSDYFMAVAFLSAQRSKDPSSQVGACIVSPERKIVGIGYNGMPNGCSDDLLPWRREAEDPLDTKYPYGERAVHGWRITLA